MRRHLRSRVLVCAFGLFGLLAQAKAALVDFEALTPAIYGNTETFSDNGYQFSVVGDFGVVDTAAGFFIAQAPTGNDTQFYSGLNDSLLGMSSLNGAAFYFTSFDAGFVAPTPQGPGVVAGRIFITGTTYTGASVQGSWEFGASDAGGLFPFETYSTGLASLGLLTSATFGACIYEGNDCINPADNLAQFSLDNINVTAVPEPSTYALLALGLAAVVLRRRVAR